MSRLARDLLIGVALALVALAGTVWSLAEYEASAGDGRGSVPQLVCPLH
jgi:hypothetical protein